ncbi:MAG: glycosyltransferase [Clostridiales bacterium]|nr:glycosyltransferase [Clostridiales bacterium]
MAEKISVIMAAYNAEGTLRDAVDSILAQSYAEIEFVICDDASVDGTGAILCEYKEKHPDRFILLQNAENKKLAFSLNRCLEHCTGSLIARMDADDISEPTRLEKQVTFLAEHSNLDLVGTAMQRFSEVGLTDIVYALPVPDKFTLRKRTPFFHATILTYKRVYDALSGYTVLPRTERGQDYDLWARFFHAGFQGANLAEPLYRVREDANAIARRSFRVRWQIWPSIVFAHKLLEYPRLWLLAAFIGNSAKSLTPYWVQRIFRRMQAARYLRRKKGG